MPHIFLKTVLHWFRRDLRVVDNTALAEASVQAERVVPIFVVESAQGAVPLRIAFLLRCVQALRKSLTNLGYTLIVRHGHAEVELPKLCREVGAQAVFANKLYEPDAEARDSRVFNALNAIGVGFELFKDAVIWEEEEILTQAGKPFTVFTPYSRVWKSKAIPAPGPKLGTSNREHRTPDIEAAVLKEPALEKRLAQSLRPAGERAALAVLRRFMNGPVFEYATHRDLPAIEGTSQLSAHLNCGTIGVRTVLSELKNARESVGTRQRHPASSRLVISAQRSCDVFLNELIWREFYVQVLHNFPHVAKGAFRAEYDQLQWSDNADHFQAWCAGATGYPIVDAAMRCLNQTGWMHNRLRMIVAMFLTKDLMISWQWGEWYFMEKLVDGDLAANNGGWQWSAGTGTDAAPYFRIFNPTMQAMKCDPAGDFVRRWVPELADAPARLIHEPWKDPALAKTSKYPARIVIHEVQRPKCLAMFSAVSRRPAQRKP